MSRINIQYIWVEHYKCLENAEFNFSAKYDIHYDKATNTLSYEKKDGYIDKFFGDNIDLTAIVGGNGAGKTTVLEMLRDLDIIVKNDDTDNAKKIKLIYVFEVDGKARIYYYTFDGKNYVFNYKFQIAENRPKTVGFKEAFGNEPEFVESRSVRVAENMHYDNFSVMDKHPCLDIMRNIVKVSEVLYDPFCNNTYIRLNDKTDLSTTNFVYDANDIREYFFKNALRHINFYTEYKSPTDDDKILPFKLRDAVDVYVNYDIEKAIDLFLEKYANVGKQIPGYAKAAEDLNLFYNTDVDGYANSDIIVFNNTLCLALFYNFIMILNQYTIFRNNYEQGEFTIATYTLVYNAVKESKNNPDNKCNWDLMNDFLTQAARKCNVNEGFALSAQNYISELITHFATYMNKIESDKSFIKDTVSLCHISGNRFKIKTAQIKDFFNTYQQSSEYSNFLNFSWGYSSGEMAMFNLFSRFYSIKDEIKAGDNALILIDEADMLYHPEWQQKYIKALVKFLPTIYEGTHLQIILATHSPIMLSDVPKQNVIYLRRDENGKTIVDPNSKHKESFGQNIFRLFNDAFFLEEGAMGEFAKERMEKLVERIRNLPNFTNNYNAEYKAIQQEIDIIGDNFIREKLQAELEKRLNIPNRVQLLEEKMAEIQEQIAMLRQQEKNGND